MKFIYQNYEIDFLYDDSYNQFRLNIENVDKQRFYMKEFTIDTFHKLQFEKKCNINNVKSGIHFFEKVLNNQSGYTLSISENTHLLSNFKNIHILTFELKGVLEEYFEIYCKFDTEERTFSMEEKVIRMMEKIKGNYEYKINNIENQLNNLQNMILNISNLIGMPQNHIQKIDIQNNIVKIPSQNNIVKIPSQNNIVKIPSQNNIVKVPSQNEMMKVPSQNEMMKVPSQNEMMKVPSQNEILERSSEPFIGLNYEEIEVNKSNIKENIIKNITIKKDKKNIKECMENNKNFYDTFYLSEDEKENNIQKMEDKEIIPKKMFITYYTHLVQNSSIPNIMNKWYDFVNNSDEHIIVNIERSYANLFMSNHGKIFIFHAYGGLVNEISLQHYGEIIGFENSVSIKNNITYIEELFKKDIDEYSQCGDSKINVINFFKRFDAFIENITKNII